MADRLLTINLRKYLVTQPRNKRINKCMKFVRDRIAHYTKTDIENVVISQELNSLIFKQYARSMVPLKLNIKIENSIATATPFGMKKEEPKIEKKNEKKPLIQKVAPKTEKPKQEAKQETK